MKKIKTFLTSSFFLLVLILINSKTAYSQIPQIYFNHLSIDDGLSQSSALAIVQDSEGFMWFGTNDGLNRFDGYNFKVFRNDADDEKSLSNNIIFSLFLSSDNTLWIGTNGGGLNKYNKETENFTSYKNIENNLNSISSDVVRTIFEDKKGYLWIGTNDGGLCKFDTKTEKFVQYVHNENSKNSISHNRVNSIIQDAEGLLWLATDYGVNIFNPETEEFNYLFLGTDSIEDKANITYDVLIEDKENIWIASKNGLYRYNSVNQEFKIYQHNENNEYSLSYNIVTSLFLDNENKIWIGTSAGLNIYDRINDRFFVYKHNSYLSNSINHDNISSVFQDISGIIWVGTWERGINFYDKLAQKFPIYENNPINENSLPDKTVRSIFEDYDGSLWVGLVEGGLFHFERNEDFSKTYLHDDYNNSSLSANTVSAIYRDSYGELWIGTWDGGINKAIFSNSTENNGKWKKIEGFKKYVKTDKNINSITDNSIQIFFEDSKKRLWIGTSDGLVIYNRESDNFYRVSDDLLFNSLSIQNAIQEDKEGNIWIGTWDGLHKISEFTDYKDIIIEYYLNVPENENSLADNRIISLLIDKNGIIWAGTYGGGFCKITVDKDSLVFKNYTEKNGLSNNVIYSLYADSKGNIWLSTNKGISKFSPLHETFTNYDESDGLQSKEFFWGAGFQSELGEIFFGGINGINAFFPDKIQDNQYIPPIVISSFKIFNENVKIGESEPLRKSILLTDLITLSYKDKILSFEFSSLHFSNPQKNQYEFMLEGFNNEWIKVNANQRIASYTNLDPGKYTFKVRGSNSDGIWNTVGTEIKIIIKPPFWETWAFRIFIILLILALVYIIFKWRLRRISKQKELLEKEVAERTKEIYHKNELLNHQKDEIQAQSEELKATNDELVKLSIVAAETDNAIIIADANGNIEWFNDGFTRLYGYKFDEYLEFYGSNITKISHNVEIENIFENLLKTKQAAHYENKTITKTGKEIWVQTTLTPIIDGFGLINKIVGIDSDITGLKNAEFEIIEKNRKIEFQNTNIKQSIRYAKTIQQAILPSNKLINKYYENFILYKPKDIVSGDFYWFSNIVTEDKELNLIAVVDCTGHGVPGAFMSMIGSRLLSEIVNEQKIISPKLILENLDKNITKALRQHETNNNDGMDVAICSIEKINENFKIIFTGAKRPLYYLHEFDSELNELHGDRKTVGGRTNTRAKINFTNQEIMVSKKCMIYLSTDGYSDQNNPERKRFNRKYLRDILVKYHNESCTFQCEILESELLKYQQDAEQRDDITLMGLRLI